MDEQNGNADPILREGIGSLHIRLSEIISDKSIREFAKVVGISEGNLRMFMKGRIPKSDDLLAIARAEKLNLEWLIAGEGPKYRDDKPLSASNLCNEDRPLYTHTTDFDEEYVLIPGYHVQVSTGNGSAWNGESVKRHLAFRRKWLKYRGLDASRLAVVFAKGDSMEPTIHNGDSILVDTSKTSLVDGSIFVLRLGDDLYAKRLQKRFDGGVEIISDNKEYSTQIVPREMLESLAIIGKVIWVGKDIH